MAKIMTNEVKTGLLVITCIAILMGFTLLAGNLSFFKEQYGVKALFGKVAGVEEAAPVRLNGVEVGKVDTVELIYTKDGDTKVLLGLILDENIKLRKGAKAYITTLGLMGEKYIELSAGNKGEEFIKTGSTIMGEDPMQMEEMVNIAKRIADEVDATLGDIRVLARNLDAAVVGNRENIDGIMGNLQRTTSNFEEFSSDIKDNPWKLLVKGSEKKKRR